MPDDVTSEFVWVPVEEINTMAKLQDGSATNYQGISYNFSSTSGATQTTGYNEPVLVTGNDADKQPGIQTVSGTTYDAQSGLYEEGGYFYNYYSNAKQFLDAMQQDYNAMVKSVIKYKGFYIGRYETSASGETVSSTIGTEDTRPMVWMNWYKMYMLQRDYSEKVKLEVVDSSMIWGSQYDAMLNWALTGNDASKVTATTNAPHDLTATYRPGTQKSDKINNVYDLEGNVVEITLESLHTDRRATRRRIVWSYLCTCF